MSDHARDEVRLACHALLVEYLSAVDHHRASTVLEIFAADAQIVARGQKLNGHAEISRFLAEREADTRRRTAHLIVNEVFELVTETRVTLAARVVLLLHHDDSGYAVDQVVETKQTFERDGGSWRITERDEAPLHPS